MRQPILILCLGIFVSALGCADATGPTIVEDTDASPEASATESDGDSENDPNSLGEPPGSDDLDSPTDDSDSTQQVRSEEDEPPTDDEPATEEEPPAETAGPPDTSKQQMSYIFLAHPDDEIAAWSTIEQSSGNYHVFVLLTRGGHTSYCENPQKRDGLDQYEPTPRDSEACKQNRLTSFHRFLNRAAATDPYLDVLEQDDPAVSDTDPRAGRYDVWSGPNSARVIFDFQDGGLAADNLMAANELVRSMKGSVLPDLPDYQAMAGSFWNANYPDCAVYDHPDHRAVHVGVYDHDLETTVQRGRSCATDPDAVYFRQVTEETWRTLMGSPNYLEEGGEPGIYRQSYGWLNPGWPASEDESAIISRTQSFWEVRH